VHCTCKPRKILRGHRRRLGGVFGQLHHQEVRGAVEVFFARRGVTGCRDQVIHHLVVGFVAGKRVAEILLHPLAVGHRAPLESAVAADQNVGPNCRPVAGVIFQVRIVVEQLVNQLRLLVGLVFEGVVAQLFHRGHAT
jgi:hypothetical protein